MVITREPIMVVLRFALRPNLFGSGRVVSSRFDGANSAASQTGDSSLSPVRMVLN